MSDAVKSYVAALPPERRAKVEAVVAAVRATAPDAEASIEYGMPHFRRGDRWLAAASQKSYVSIYFCGSAEIAAALKTASPRARGGKACVNYPDGVPLPPDALAEAVASVFA